MRKFKVATWINRFVEAFVDENIKDDDDRLYFQDNSFLMVMKNDEWARTMDEARQCTDFEQVIAKQAKERKLRIWDEELEREIISEMIDMQLEAIVH